MKKKISLFVCMLIAVLCFTGCSGKSSEADYDVASMEETVEVIISSFTEMTNKDFEQYKDLTEFQLNYVMMNSGLRIEAKDFLSMIESWEAGEEECGTFVSHGDYKVNVKGDEVVISTEAEYRKRTATLSFTFSKDSYLESMDVSATYSMKEILTKSGLNTVLGMGTVFAVLIFLAFLIYLMKYIPTLMELVSKKGSESAESAVTVAPPSVRAVQEVQDVDTVDDLELVAVITAAIAAQEGTTTDGFVVRSIRRRPSNNWR